MKKTLIAMAVLAAASAASAQSSVTLYGRLDLGLNNTKSKATDVQSGMFTKTSYTSLFGAQNNYTTSRLGVTGTEDLGGGKAAFFTYEFAINPEGHAVGSTRVANAGIKGGFGSIAIGTMYNAIDSARSLGNPGSTNFADAFSEGYDGSTMGSLFSLAGFPGSFTGSAAGHIGGRSSNALQYTSPTVGGITAVVTVGSETSKVNTTPATKSKDSTAIVGLQYAGGGLSAQIAYGSAKVENTVLGVLDKVKGKDLVVAASYKVNFGSGSATPRVIYEGSQGKVTSSTVGSFKNKRTYFGVGSGFEFGAFGPWISLGFGKLKSDLGAQNIQVKEKGFEVGTTYAISKRTSMYAFYNSAKERIKANTVEVGKVTRSGVSVGLVHKF